MTQTPAHSTTASQISRQRIARGGSTLNRAAKMIAASTNAFSVAISAPVSGRSGTLSIRRFTYLNDEMTTSATRSSPPPPNVITNAMTHSRRTVRTRR